MTVPRPMMTDTYRNVIMVIISRSWSKFTILIMTDYRMDYVDVTTRMVYVHAM